VSFVKAVTGKLSFITKQNMSLQLLINTEPIPANGHDPYFQNDEYGVCSMDAFLPLVTFSILSLCSRKMLGRSLYTNSRTAICHLNVFFLSHISYQIL
jgi:hypothetical protein